MSFKAFMAERREVNRWFVLRIGIMGAIAGALLATIFMLLGIVQ